MSALNDLNHVWGSHSICEACWVCAEGDREPVRLREPEEETCCFCGIVHGSGIYYRARGDGAPHCKCESA